RQRALRGVRREAHPSGDQGGARNRRSVAVLGARRRSRAARGRGAGGIASAGLAAGGGVARAWGSTAAERALELPCDGLLEDPDDVYHRALDVDAPAPVVFRWLCQLRTAPYSYDVLDNFGRRSPRTLTPGLDELAA